MKVLECPLNGPRNISEFACGGEVVDMPPPDAGIREWADYTFIERNARGLVREWWIHLPSSYWFIVERDTATNAITRTYSADELYPEQSEAAKDD